MIEPDVDWFASACREPKYDAPESAELRRDVTRVLASLQLEWKS